MTAGNYNIVIEKGATFSKILTLKDSENNPVDLTGVTPVAKLRERSQDNDSWTFTVTVTDAANGLVSWVMAADVTATIDCSRGVYQMDLIYDDNSVERILTGTVAVNDYINRSDT